MAGFQSLRDFTAGILRDSAILWMICSTNKGDPKFDFFSHSTKFDLVNPVFNTGCKNVAETEYLSAPMGSNFSLATPIHLLRNTSLHFRCRVFLPSLHFIGFFSLGAECFVHH
jgi:hypothetical protein